MKLIQRSIKDPVTVKHVQSRYLFSKKAGIRTTPTYIIEGKELSLGQLAALVEERF